MKWLIGSVRFTVQNGSVPLINKLKDFKITRITLAEDEVLQFSAPLIYKKRILRLLGKNDFVFTENRSVIRGFAFMYAQMFLTVSLMSSVVILMLLSNLVFRIDVVGLEGEEYASVASHVQSLGVRPLISKRGVDKALITTELSSFPFVAHVNTQLRGTRLVINIYHVDNAPEAPITDLVSRFDAVITDMVVASGTPVVQIGQVVSRGQSMILAQQQGIPTHAVGIVHGEVRKSVTATTRVEDKELAIHNLFVKLLQESSGIMFDTTETFFNQVDESTVAIELVGIANIVIS